MKIGAVILAAGESSRMGSIKQLLQIGGKPILQHVIDAAEKVDFSNIVIVLGANYDEIIKSIKIPKITEIIRNNDWREGQATSVRAGVNHLVGRCDAIIFLLGDQPFVSVELMRKEIMAFSTSSAEIIAPIFEGKRGNPVLFGRDCFKELLHLQGERGGKTLFATHRVKELDWAESLSNFDIDTMQEYNKAVLINNAHSHLSTIILSAGLSTRMKQAKLLMPWEKTTVLGATINSFRNAGIGDIRVVTGGYRELVEKEATSHHAKCVFNPDFANGEMIDSMKVGFRSLANANTKAAFVALGDQPGVSSEDILQMAKLFFDTNAPLIIPSFAMRRGHPWLISRELWDDILNLKFPQTMRDFIEQNKQHISYYVVKSSRILEDLDTPEDYEKYKPRG